jgi:alkanesulfonate monooxygenase SsuD/methylene tetrahydromethanopterin reductase-like flavin-dependent oxidoreductase (luciferase family)
VLIGGTGPKTLALAGEIADGIILDSQYTPTTVLDALNHVRSGRVDRGDASFGTVLFEECAADEVAQSAGSYLDAGIDTLVFQPAGPVSTLHELITAAGELATR